MTSIQDRNKLKRVSYDTWSTREQLCLASSVLKSGDQNWIGVSRSLKPFAEKEALRPPDWFSQKSCAMQYAILLENADTPKRKKRESGETAGESIVRRLTQERIAELGQILAFQRDEYQQLKAEVNLLRSGTITEEKLQKMWLVIEQEERDQEQKARAHAAWLAKRQQKQELQSQSLQTVTIASPRKSLEQTASEAQEAQGENDEEEKKNRGGRSPLLTSLLKSPSPTTQMQTATSSAQPTSSPTIASLLGSSPKIPNAQIVTSMPSQLHQLVTSAMTNAVAERPSVGAPTLSMLLELPANLQRGSLASLQQAASNVQQQIAKPDIHTQSHPIKQTISQVNESTTVRPATVAPIIHPPESMVQIIDQVDDVIRKDIMADVINKDEINEIIGDLEELIKEEITASSPRHTPPISITAAPVVPLVEKPPPPEVEKVIVTERLEPRDVDEAVSLSNSPQSEMAIEEIDQSTSSIAEIIGTVAIEPVEPKVTVVPVVVEEPAADLEKNKDKHVAELMETETKEADKMEVEIVQEAKIEEKSPPVDTVIPEEPMKESIAEKSSVTDDPIEDVKVDEKPDQKIDGVVPDVEATSPVPPAENTSEKEAEKEHEEPVAEETCAVAVTDEETAGDPIDAPKDSTHETKETNDPELDEIKVNLAKITGDQYEVGSPEVVSVCSEVTTDIPSIEDNEKSQDISMILEDEESSQSSSSKKKDTDDQSLIENLNDASDSQESFKDTPVAKDPPKETINESSTDVESPRPEVLEESIDCKKVIVEDSKDSEDGASSASSDVEKKEKIEEAAATPDIEEESVEIEKTESNEKEEKHEKVDEEREEKEEKEEKEEEDEEEEDEEEEEEEEEEREEEEAEEEEEEEEEEVKAETAEKEEKEEKIDKEETELDETSKPGIQEIEEKKCATPTEDKPDIKDESDTESLIKQLEEPKKEETEELKEEKEDDEKPMDYDVSVKKDTVESTGSICDDIADLDEEESSLSKLSGGRAMKTYSKKQTIAIDSEPENESSGENADYRAWKKAVMLVYNRLATHKYASLFLRPITEDQAPGYHSVIFRPMDLSTIKKNIDNGTIRSTMHFQRDVMLMFQNAIMYNKQDTFVYKMAVSMQEECLQHMQILVQVTGEGQLRRETRTAASSSSETSDPSVKRKRSHITPSPHDTESPRGKKRRKSENE